MSLVADYGNSSPSGSDSSSDISNNENSQTEIVKQPKQPYPLPNFIIGIPDNSKQLLETSVFRNPYKEAKAAEQAILEKHVKMVDIQDNAKFINGKKACWYYRKGTCRFGHNCSYAHDSDIRRTEESSHNEDRQNHKNLRRSMKVKGKSRPGLTQGLVPGKRIMKNYYKQQVKLVSNNNH